MSEKNIRVKFVEEVIRIKLHEGIQGTIGATGTTGAPSTIPGPAGTTGATGTTGAAGTTDHAELEKLGYDESGHTGFQRELIYIPEYRSYQIE